MEIHAKVALILPNEFYKTTLSYDTYEKATYDVYLIAALRKHESSERKAFKYIDEITGNGSLNNHFKKLYKKISELTDKQVDGILENSLYPITKYEKGHFKYYKMLDASRLNDHSYPGNLKDDEQKLIDALMPKEEDVKFLKMEYEEGEASLRENIYEAIFSEEGIQINMGDGKFYPIKQRDFASIFNNDLEGCELDCAVGKKITNGNWNVLQAAYLNAIKNSSSLWFHDRHNNLCVLNSEFIKKIEVIEIFGLFFYKETRCDFTPNYEEEIVDALEYLEKSKNINTFKTKSLVQMLKCIDDLKAQDCVNYILTRKESKEIADVGLGLLMHGLEIGWEDKAILQFKKFADISCITRIYELNPNLDYSIEELLNIDDGSLSKAHLKEKQAYMTQRQNMMDEIYKMLGEMDASGIREKLKSLPKDNVVKSVNEFYKEYKAHTRIDYESLSLEELSKKYQFIKSIFDGNYAKVKARLNTNKD